MDTYMTTEELATLCRTSPGTCRYWRHIGEGPASIKVGRRVLYRREDVTAWLERKYAEQHPRGGDAA